MSLFAIFLLVILLFMFLFGVVSIISANEAGTLEGRRAAIKAAIELTRERQDVSLYMAPEGELNIGMIRARAIHDIEMELRRMLVEVGQEQDRHARMDKVK